MPKSSPKPREELCADKLFALLRTGFDHLRDDRRGEDVIPTADALMAGLAVFSLKYPSLLAFEQRPDDNLRSIFHLRAIPSDTHMRRVLDEVNPLSLRPAFTAIFTELQRGGALKQSSFLDHYLISLDGTEHFSSETVHCDQCLTKTHENGTVSYHHQLLGAALVHPDHREVIPLCPEAIVCQDGKTKNDCEYNATKRWLKAFRQEHPRLPVIITEDGLSSNAPHIDDLQTYDCRFILGVKETNHRALFVHLRAAEEHGELTIVERSLPDGTTQRFRLGCSVPLNKTNPETEVNVLEYWETAPTATKPLHFAWVTDLPLTEETCEAIMRGGRARCRIENETFNTLKNQGYHFEHNFGHGENYLSTVFSFLMLLAFLVDQVQQLCCPIFQHAWEVAGSKRELWERLRALFRYFVWESMADLLRASADGIERRRLQPESS